MAKSNNPIKDPSPLARLTDETMGHMDGIKEELDEAAKGLEALESLGIDTSRLREKIDWGYKARDVILKTFGRKE